MRKILTMTAALLGLAAYAQQTYTVSGTAAAGIGQVYIVDIAKRFAPIDSAKVTNGQFTLSGTQPENALLGVGNKEFALLFFNDGTPLVADLSAQTLKGSALNEKLNAYDRELSPIDTQLSQIVQQAGTTPPEKMDSLIAVYNQLESQKEARQIEIIRQNPANLIPVAFITDLAYSLDYAQLKEICNPDHAYYNHPAMKLPKRLLEGLEKRAPGKLFTDMMIKDIDGADRRLSDWIGKGQYVMVDFWASWCGPCRQEMPNVVANYAKYHAKGFEIVGISFDLKDASWKSAVSQMGMTWPQLSDLRGWQSAAAGIYGISSIPASILFDGEGKIVALDLRGAKLGAKLQEIYGF